MFDGNQVANVWSSWDPTQRQSAARARGYFWRNSLNVLVYDVDVHDDADEESINWKWPSVRSWQATCCERLPVAERLARASF